MRGIKAAMVVLVAMLAITAVSAQSGGLTVQVVDSTGPLPGATVTISHEAGFIKTTSILTGKKGIADFPVLRPGKGYIIEVQFPGFGVRRIPAIHVKISQVTPLTVQLSEEIQERVKVVAQSDVVSLEETAQTSRFSDEFIQDLPVAGRFYQNVLTLAPGVQDSDGDGNPNVHGSRDRDFKAMVSGISNVDPLTGQQMSQVNPNSIEEIEVITAGAGVEFSRAQGGFAQILQKQGSNEFEGVFELFYRSSRLDGDGSGDFSALPEADFDWIQPSFQVSGPLIKDKLWYRLSHELIDREDPINVTSGVEITTRKQQINSDQLTWQVSPRNKLAFQFQSDPLEINNFGVSSLTPPEAAQKIEVGTASYALIWTAPLSPKVLVDSRVAWQDLNTKVSPATTGLPNNCVAQLGDSQLDFLSGAQCRNADTAEVSGSFFRTLDDNSQRLTVKSDATVFGGRFWGMSHTFKLGVVVENERYFRDLERRASLNVFRFDSTTDAQDGTGDEEPEQIIIMQARLAIPQQSNVRATGTTWGLYVEDTIRPTNNLSITAGLRVDREEINSNGLTPFDPEQELQDFIGLTEEGITATNAVPLSFTAYEAVEDFINQLAGVLGVDPSVVGNQVANSTRQSAFWNRTRRVGNIDIANTNFTPALSVSWDPWSNGKTKLAFTARRYYDKLFLNIPLIELEPATTDIVFDAEDTEAGFVPTGLRSSINPAVNISAVDRNLSTPYQDEFTFSFEREIFPETSVKLTYINRKFKDQLQDLDLNHVPGDYGRCKTASLNSPNTIEAVQFGDPDYNPAFAPGDGTIDDCAGELVIPDNLDLDESDPFARSTRLEEPDGIPDLYLQNPGWGDIFLVGNFNKIDYEAWVVELIRRQYRSWELQASYTWSEATGDGEDFNQALGDDRSLLDDESGYQSYDQRHVVKVNATTITPWGVRLGGTVTWQSGLPYSVASLEPSFDQVAPQFESFGAGNSARTRLQYENSQRNDQRNDSYWNVDLKLTKEFNLARGLNMQISGEIFNVLNDGTYQIYDPILEAGLQINGNNIARNRFGRRWQVGVKFAF